MKEFAVKAVLVLLLLLLAVTMGGCAAVSKISDAVNNVTSKVNNDKETDSVLSFLTEHDVTNETRAAANDYQAKLGNVDSILAGGKEDIGFWEMLSYGKFTKQSAYETKLGRAKADAAMSKTNLNVSIANDDIYRSEIEDDAAPGSKQDKGKKLDVGVIIIIVVVVLLIVLFVFLNKRSTKPKRKAIPVSQPAVHELTDRQATNFKANKMNACRKMASKVGVDADKELDKYNGDVDALYMALVRMQPLDDD